MKVKNIKYILLFGIISISIYFTACSDKTTEPPPVAAVIVDGEQYFPTAEGDTWYYTDVSNLDKITRVVSGDTTVNGITAIRILHNDTTAEAWLINSSGFYIHLLDGILRFQPPLAIPFNLVQNQPRNFDSDVFIVQDSNLYQAETRGNLTFKGYVTKNVPAGQFDSVLQFYYDVEEPPSQYDEYYAKGVGLLDNGNLRLDSAFVGGVWYRQ